MPDVPVLVVGDDDSSASLRVVKHETVVVGGGGGEGQGALGQQPLQDPPVVTLALLHPILEVWLKNRYECGFSFLFRFFYFFIFPELSILMERKNLK